MLQFILRRLGLVIPTFIGITLLTFAFVHMIPGDPVMIMAGERGISPERHAQLLAELGLDKPLWQQYLHYIWGVLHGDLGISLKSRLPVWDEFVPRFKATLELGVCAMIFAVAGGYSGRGTGGGQARLYFRSHRGGHRADRLLDADLLVGHDADHAGLGAAQPDAGVRPRQRHGLPRRQPSADRLHADRHSALGRRGRLHRCRAAHDPAGHRAGHHPAGGDRAHDPLLDAGSAGRRLHPHRARQGPDAACA